MLAGTIFCQNNTSRDILVPTLHLCRSPILSVAALSSLTRSLLSLELSWRGRGGGHRGSVIDVHVRTLIHNAPEKLLQPEMVPKI